ncbi:hypothetical protein E4J66_12140 [Actinomyces viscosus]|uniref:Uncharacterized protein n=1 Tax=Actinomyces viscosus TaxID=1656 RepID=A0A3S4VBL6_ACTVI|nr:hypothetical protein [Actinomyces viscosus]TFH51385.1 hypothetical protein E4J66_12140 [Actinomyces viscosus]VEI17420.1 Uncharacterised protein [Actinomyces viscosus]
MRLTKRNLIKTAAISSAFVGALAVAAPTSANSFGPTDYGTGGQAMVSYNDGADRFCITNNGLLNPTYIYIGPFNGRGPSHFLKVYQGQTKCVSLARAYEDSRYYYEVNGHKPVDFYS